MRALVLLVGLCAGCTGSPVAFPADARPVIDRRFIEYPTGLELRTAARGFSAATALAIAPDGIVFVADRGQRDSEVRITRLDPVTGETTEVYPARRGLFSGYFDRRLRLFGPVGGMAVVENELIITARDREDNGIVVAMDLASIGGEERPRLRTVVGELPAQGDHGLTAIAVHPNTGRLYFGLGSATNSGVVGVDNWEGGWLRDHERFHDRPLVDLKIGGYRFDTEDPAAGPLNPDKVNTSPFSPFRYSLQRIAAAEGGRPTAAIYSVDRLGGDLRVEAHGLRNPRGLAFTDRGNLYASNQGMELRGTRPVKDDPDAVLIIPLTAGLGALTGSTVATWFGWPDYSADLVSITDERFQPPPALLGRTGYRELSPLIDYRESDLQVADRDTMVVAALPSLSGASGMAFVPQGAAGFEDVEGLLVVALQGDRAPFATSGLPLLKPVGRKVVLVSPDNRSVWDFVYNTTETKAQQPPALNRPVDVAFAPDGSMWLLDTGRMRLRNGQERHKPGSGRLYRLAPPAPAPTDLPATRETGE